MWRSWELRDVAIPPHNLQFHSIYTITKFIQVFDMWWYKEVRANQRCEIYFDSWCIQFVHALSAKLYRNERNSLAVDGNRCWINYCCNLFESFVSIVFRSIRFSDNKILCSSLLSLSNSLLLKWISFLFSRKSCFLSTDFFYQMALVHQAKNSECCKPSPEWIVCRTIVCNHASVSVRNWCAKWIFIG